MSRACSAAPRARSAVVVWRATTWLSVVLLCAAVVLRLLGVLPLRRGDRELARRLVNAVRTSHVAEVDRLLGAGADPNSADERGRSALFFAANRDPRMVRLLLTHGANVNLRDDRGRTPYRMVRQMNTEQERLLREAGGVL